MAERLKTELPADWDDNPDWTAAKTKPIDTPAMLKIARVKLGLTQAAAAELLAVPLSTLQNWEQRRTEPDEAAKTLIRLFYTHPQEVSAWLSAA